MKPAKSPGLKQTWVVVLGGCFCYLDLASALISDCTGNFQKLLSDRGISFCVGRFKVQKPLARVWSLSQTLLLLTTWALWWQPCWIPSKSLHMLFPLLGTPFLHLLWTLRSPTESSRLGVVLLLGRGLQGACGSQLCGFYFFFPSN